MTHPLRPSDADPGGTPLSSRVLSTRMYRVVLTEGVVECDRYERSDHGVDCYVDGQFAAFVPYENCHGVLDEEVVDTDERSVW